MALRPPRSPGSSHFFIIEEIVIVIVVAHGHFAQKDRAAGLWHDKVMVHIRRDGDALSGFRSTFVPAGTWLVFPSEHTVTSVSSILSSGVPLYTVI